MQAPRVKARQSTKGDLQQTCLVLCLCLCLVSRVQQPAAAAAASSQQLAALGAGRWARPAPQGRSEAVAPPSPEVTTRGRTARHSHRLYSLFFPSAPHPSLWLWRCLRALIPHFVTCRCRRRADRTFRVLFNSAPSAGALVSAPHRAKPHAAEVERLAPHGLFGLTFHVCQQAASRQRAQYIQGKLW
jgi:hypothetical protein